MERLTYENSCRVLQQQRLLRPDELPPMPDRMPSEDDEEPLGIEFFRTGVEGAKLDNLTIPRTFFGRSEITRTSFVNTDLSESRLCWTDFIDVDFSTADLAGSDLRAAVFTRVRFDGVNLSNCDLRGATFERCTFAGAVTDGLVLSKGDHVVGSLSKEQLAGVRFEPAGEEPPGG